MSARHLQAPPAAPPCVTLAEALDSPLRRWWGWQIRTRCADACCPPGPIMPVAEVTAARDRVTVRRMAAQLRCCVCGQPVGHVALVREDSRGRIVQPIRGRAEP